MNTPVADVRITGVAVGGDGVAREPSGRVLFVEGALPGERVIAEVVEERRDHARGVVVEVLEPAPARVSPPCPFVAAGCGGCGWQHVELAAQRSSKVDMVADALARLGGVPDPVVHAGPATAAAGYRTTLRGVADAEGRFALRRHHSHELVAVPGCLVAHRLVVEVLTEGRFPPGAEVTVRVGARTGERLVVVDEAGAGDDGSEGRDRHEGPEADEGHEGHDDHGEGRSREEVVLPGADVDEVSGARDGVAGGEVGGHGGPDHESGGRPFGDVLVPEGVRVVTGAQLAAGKRAWLYEEVAGVRLRVSARSFFQAGPEAAEALVAAVGEALGEVGEGTRMADLYGGVGLFAATVGRGARVELVEASASAAADARINLRGSGARVVRSDVGRWHPRRADVVVADPPRAGLGRAGARAVAATRAGRVALVSCDAGALGRDTRLLHQAGYDLVSSTLVDVFVHTPHVEVVSTFVQRRR